MSRFVSLSSGVLANVQSVVADLDGGGRPRVLVDVWLLLALLTGARARTSPSDLDLTGTGRWTFLSSFFLVIQSMDFDLDFRGVAGMGAGF